MKNKTGEKNKASADMLATIIEDCSDALAFLKAVSDKSP